MPDREIHLARLKKRACVPRHFMSDEDGLTEKPFIFERLGYAHVSRRDVVDADGWTVIGDVVSDVTVRKFHFVVGVDPLVHGESLNSDRSTRRKPISRSSWQRCRPPPPFLVVLGGGLGLPTLNDNFNPRLAI